MVGAETCVQLPSIRLLLFNVCTVSHKMVVVHPVKLRYSSGVQQKHFEWVIVRPMRQRQRISWLNRFNNGPTTSTTSAMLAATSIGTRMVSISWVRGDTRTPCRSITKSRCAWTRVDFVVKQNACEKPRDFFEKICKVCYFWRFGCNEHCCIVFWFFRDLRPRTLGKQYKCFRVSPICLSVWHTMPFTMQNGVFSHRLPLHQPWTTLSKFPITAHTPLVRRVSRSTRLQVRIVIAVCFYTFHVRISSVEVGHILVEQ